MQKKDCIDWMHGNTLFWDFEDDMIYYNSRSLDSFYKIDRVWPGPEQGLAIIWFACVCVCVCVCVCD